MMFPKCRQNEHDIMLIILYDHFSSDSCTNDIDMASVYIMYYKGVVFFFPILYLLTISCSVSLQFLRNRDNKVDRNLE